MIRLFHFLGGLIFALMLIATTALFVIGGTFIESWTGSHRHAAHFTYASPLFTGLLALFFVNILFAALRRWPFRPKHIPFLLTHLGLLMLIAGAMIKSLYGIQGSLRVLEGGVSDELILPNSYAIHVQNTEGQKKVVPLGQLAQQQDPELTIVEYLPDASVRYVSWVKGDHASIVGLKPFPLSTAAPYERGALVRVFSDESEPWEVYGIKADNVAGAAYQVYIQNLDVVISERHSGKLLYTGPFIDLLGGQPSLAASLHFGYNCEEGFVDPAVLVACADNVLAVALNGQRALLNQYVKTSDVPVAIDLIRKPALALIQNQDNKTFLFAFDPHGQVHAQSFSTDELGTVVMYDRGFGGYAFQAEIPFGSAANGRLEREQQLRERKLPPTRSFTIESALIPLYEAKNPNQKWEDHRPKVTVKVKHAGKSQYVALGFDPSVSGMKWPALGGDFLLRFQPNLLPIPYEVRLRQARQITYSNSTQPYSFESDVLITDKRTGKATQTTLSMNEVHETSDGYRFYMANLSPSDCGKCKEVQIVVNYDPVRYSLTYPGGFVLASGIIGLFWLRPYFKRRNR